MNIPYLFPNRFKKIGWILFIPSAILGLYIVNSDNAPHFLEYMSYHLCMKHLLLVIKKQQLISF